MPISARGGATSGWRFEVLAQGSNIERMEEDAFARGIERAGKRKSEGSQGATKPASRDATTAMITSPTWLPMLEVTRWNILDA